MVSCAFLCLLPVLSLLLESVYTRAVQEQTPSGRVLILGGGVAGVIAARTLHEQGINDFIIIEARDELGGRMMSHAFGVPENQHVVEVGCNWVQGTQRDGGPENTIYTLAKKHQLSNVYNDWNDIKTYDWTGAVDYLDVFRHSEEAYSNLTIAAGGTNKIPPQIFCPGSIIINITYKGARVEQQLTDGTARTGYQLIGTKSGTPHAMASEYYQFIRQYAQTPEQSSWITSSQSKNFTYNTYGNSNLMSTDQRGFKHIVLAEADEFLNYSSQVMLNSTVKTISYSNNGASVTLVDGIKIEGGFVLCTFSLGVLQHDDVVFNPPLPSWKKEAIQNMTMTTYTKIFLQFPSKFWFDNEMGISADRIRGRYPVWQSLDHEKFLPGSGLFFVTVTGDWSVAIESLTDAEVQKDVMPVVHAMFPNVTVPDPIDFYFQRWHSDPLYRGSYSNWPPSFFNKHHENLRATVLERLWFAGEATSKQFFGFLQGAYFEGLLVSKDMISRIKARGDGDVCGLAHVAEVTNTLPYQDLRP